jgi:hypothetical protein
MIYDFIKGLVRFIQYKLLRRQWEKRIFRKEGLWKSHSINSTVTEWKKCFNLVTNRFKIIKNYGNSEVFK